MKEIGEYFALELSTAKSYYPGAAALDFARSALRYIIREYRIKEIYIPYYTCYVVWKAALDEGAKVKFYHIGNDFMPKENIPENAYLLYTDYFGVMYKNVVTLAKQYPNLIVDNAEAFFAPHSGLASFNSARKFFGVPDGAYLFCNRTDNIKKLPVDNTSWERASHLLKKIDLGTDSAYADFQLHDNPPPTKNIKRISNLSEKLLSSIDYETAKKRRLENFFFLHENLKGNNLFSLNNLMSEDIPMVYPYLTEKGEETRIRLFKNNIYTAVYFGNYPPSYYESYLRKNLIPLPIDQRYDTEDMQKIINTVL